MTTKEYRIGNEWPNDLPTCIVPWTSITLSANGDIKPCCKFTSDKKLALEAGKINLPPTHSSGGPLPHMNIYEGHTLQNAWEGMEPLRQAMLKKKNQRIVLIVGKMKTLLVLADDNGCWKKLK